jgi:hypothetical protein
MSTNSSPPLDLGSGPAHTTLPPELPISFPTHLVERMKPFQREFSVYLQELPRLLEQGEEGRFVVLQGGQLHGDWDIYRDAVQYGNEKFGVDLLFLAQKIDGRLLQRYDAC